MQNSEQSRKNHPIQTKRGKAFTLVELLVVISIIALLLAILLPGLNGARDVAQLVKCEANQRQVTLAFNLYVDDNQQSYPMWREAVTGMTGAIWWPARFMERNLLPDGQVFQCPSFNFGWKDDFTFKELNLTNYPQLNNYRYNRVQYGYNAYNLGCSYRSQVQTGVPAYVIHTPATPSPPARSSQITRPAQTLLLTDSIDKTSYDANTPFGSYAVVDYWPGTIYAANARHQQGRTLPIAWVDGHVSTMSADPNDLLSPYTGELGVGTSLTDNYWNR